MTKHLYRHSTRLQEQLLGAALLHGPEWPRHTPRIYLDAWASLWRWHLAGEHVIRLTEEMEQDLLARPLPPDLPLATAPLQHEALAIQLPDPGQWIVIARHPAKQPIQVQGDVAWVELSPMLTYCASGSSRDALHSGYHNLRDQPTPAALQLAPGIVTDIATDITARPLNDVDILTDDYALTLALHVLYTRR